jgi:hypothetical protein
VSQLTDERVMVQFDEGTEFELTPETWRNIRYKYNAEEDEIHEEELGAFTQYPVRLAWAITIHKSQGLTFEKAIIDAGSSFAPGQVYVALSRCTSLDGMILKTPITAKQIATDPLVVEFSKNLHTEMQLQQELALAVEEYEKEYFLKLFNFDKVQQAINDWASAVPSKKLPNLQESVELSKKLKLKVNELIEVATKTQRWIDQHFTTARTTGEYDKLVNGLKRSVHHFNAFLHDEFFVELQHHYDLLQGKSKVKKYLNLVHDLATIIINKAKKIRLAAWQNRVLVEDQLKTFTELATTIRKGQEVKEKGSSTWETFALFQRGLDVQKIAEMRGLAKSTIEGHLLEAIRAGKLAVDALVHPEKIATISKAIITMGATKSSELKVTLGDDYSFTEIRAVLFYVQLVKAENANP